MINGTNQYGVPWHACYGYRADAHYWAWIAHRVATEPGEFFEWIRAGFPKQRGKLIMIKGIGGK